MITLCMDTSHRFLTLALLKEDRVVGAVQKECFKRQSETVLEELDQLLKNHHVDKREISAVCVTRGPGSYTGVRIAMTIAKVMCARWKLPLYTLSTLELFACDQKDCLVLLDARGGRAYRAIYRQGVLQQPEAAETIERLRQSLDPSLEIMGDCSLLGMEEKEEDYALSFLLHRNHWRHEENVHTCVPEYLKENSAYLVKS